MVLKYNWIFFSSSKNKQIPMSILKNTCVKLINKIVWLKWETLEMFRWRSVLLIIYPSNWMKGISMNKERRSFLFHLLLILKLAMKFVHICQGYFIKPTSFVYHLVEYSKIEWICWNDWRKRERERQWNECGEFGLFSNYELNVMNYDEVRNIYANKWKTWIGCSNHLVVAWV